MIVTSQLYTVSNRVTAHTCESWAYHMPPPHMDFSWIGIIIAATKIPQGYPCYAIATLRDIYGKAVLGGGQRDEVVEFGAFTAMLHSRIVVHADGAVLFRLYPEFELGPCPEGLFIKGDKLEEGRGGNEGISESLTCGWTVFGTRLLSFFWVFSVTYTAIRYLNNT
ncbi:hypothetical protein EDB89DRAFT_2232123 [Lactarius sanguifluus]|nr:hypothetical protein EDB89DRAFT_2232123 [Lactarius sanguifluus]